MRHFFTTLVFLFTLSLSAQDVIITSSNEELNVKVEEIKIETISYKKIENLSGPLYHINKSGVKRIIFENGQVETFETVSYKQDKTKEISIEQTRAFLIENIDKYCYDDNAFLRNSFKATFEGDYLRLTLMNKKGTRQINSMVYDIENVYDFKYVDKRKKELSYLNIFVPYLKYENKNKWEKHKLVMSVEGHDNAESILNALKHYNSLLKRKSKKPGQKF